MLTENINRQQKIFNMIQSEQEKVDQLIDENTDSLSYTRSFGDSTQKPGKASKVLLKSQAR